MLLYSHSRISYGLWDPSTYLPTLSSSQAFDWLQLAHKKENLYSLPKHTFNIFSLNYSPIIPLPLCSLESKDKGISNSFVMHCPNNFSSSRADVKTRLSLYYLSIGIIKYSSSYSFYMEFIVFLANLKECFT